MGNIIPIKKEGIDVSSQKTPTKTCSTSNWYKILNNPILVQARIDISRRYLFFIYISRLVNNSTSAGSEGLGAFPLTILPLGSISKNLGIESIP